MYKGKLESQRLSMKNTGSNYLTAYYFQHLTYTQVNFSCYMPDVLHENTIMIGSKACDLVLK